MIDVEVDLTGVGASLGSIIGISDAVKSRVYISDLVESAQHELGSEFNTHMNVISRSQPSRFHHVYEWNRIGIPGYRLWRNVYMGAGGHKTTSFEFLPSRTEVPLPNPAFPPGPQGQQVHRRSIFWNKARVMEYGLPVVIRTKTAKFLFINLRDGYSAGIAGSSRASQKDSDRGFTFAQEARAYNVGGRAVVGQFTAAFAQFYAQDAPRLFETKVKPRIEASTDQIILSSGNKSMRGRVGKNLGWKSYTIAFNAARELSRSEAEIQAARYRDSGYGEKMKDIF